MPLDNRQRDLIAFCLAVALGPLFTVAGYAMHLIYGAAAVFYFLCCALVIPFVTLASVRFRFLTWQLAVFSMLLSVIVDNLRIGGIRGRDAVTVPFIFWAVGTLFSSPVPAYLFLRSMKPRNRYIFGVLIVLLGIALWLGVKRITG